MRKTVLLLALLSLTACGNSESADESDQTAIQDDTVIELEDTEDAEGNEEAVKADYFNKNPKIDSQIYREYFSDKELLDEGRMESDIEGDNKVAEAKMWPTSTEVFPDAYYMNYAFNLVEERLNLALIMTEDAVIKESELPEDIFIHLEYDQANDSLISVTQENTAGEEVDYADLTEEEWNDVAKEYIQFVDRVHQ